MQKLLFIPVFILLILGGVSTVKATDVYISSEFDDSAITGVISAIRFEEIELIVNGERIDVDVDALDLDEGQKDIIAVGDEVRFTGEFDDNEFVADSMLLLNANSDVNVIDE